MCHGNCVNSGSRIRRSPGSFKETRVHIGVAPVREQGHGALAGGEACKYSQFIATQTKTRLNCNDFDSQNATHKKERIPRPLVPLFCMLRNGFEIEKSLCISIDHCDWPAVADPSTPRRPCDGLTFCVCVVFLI